MFSLVYLQMDLHIITLNYLLFSTYSYNEYVATSYLKKKINNNSLKYSKACE